MATYGQFYFKVLQKISNEYTGLHNLSNLDQLDKKIKCYNQFNKQANKYYECFRSVEQKRSDDAAALNNDYVVIQDQYKLCTEGCKQLGEEDMGKCNSKCGQTFSNCINVLYDKFYKQRVNHRKQYKKVKP